MRHGRWIPTARTSPGFPLRESRDRDELVIGKDIVLDNLPDPQDAPVAKTNEKAEDAEPPLIQSEPFSEEKFNDFKLKTMREFGISENEVDYLVFKDLTSNYAYNPEGGNINILFKDGTIADMSKAADQLNISVLSQPVTKHFLCYPKVINYR